MGGCSLVEDAEGDSSSINEQRSALEGDFTTTVCGMDSRPSPSELAADPCASGELELAENFQRSPGAPIDDARGFELAEDSRVCVTVDANDVDAGAIYVDGEAVVSPDQFAEGKSFRYTLDLDAGAHTITAQLQSIPGSSLDVEVRSRPSDEMEPMFIGDSGILEVTNVAVDHPLFSPNGDGYHDDTLFNADNYPRDLPGKELGIYDYYLDWSWEVIDASTCNSIGVVHAGTTEVNSPTNVQALWAGSASDSATVALSSTTDTDTTVEDGSYLYKYDVTLMRSDGMLIDSTETELQGVEVDSSSDPDFGDPVFGTECDPEEDPYKCECPDEPLPDGDRCTYASIHYDLDSFDELSEVNTEEFITTHYDSEEDRYTVIVDLRTYNGGGLIPQGDGTWSSIEDLQKYIEELTGVPADPKQRRLFNFDFIQLGYSTGVVDGEGIVNGFNHFLLDVITDRYGEITFDTGTYDLKELLADSTINVPEEFLINDERTGEECAYNGNTDGDSSVTAKGCTQVQMANLDPDRTNLGIYRIESRIWDLRIDDIGTTRDQHCIINGTYDCRVRTIHREGDMHLGHNHYVEEDTIDQVRDLGVKEAGVAAFIFDVDRHWGGAESTTPIDGICSDGLAVRNETFDVPLDTAAGAVSESCIINGTY
ncbi:MAG: hypothetical protein ACLFVJ_08625 [Persicimonas sp.]